MNISNKKEIELSVEEIAAILLEFFDKTQNIRGDSKVFTWKIVNKMIPGPDPHDGYDNYVFDGVKIVVSE
jgi:hypothetical protein